MKVILDRKDVEQILVEKLENDGMPVEGKTVKMKFTANTVEVNITNGEAKEQPDSKPSK